MNPTTLLKQHFGYDAFRDGQEELIAAIVSGKDAMGVMPTGAGKSICYQVAGLMLPGIALVVSPLISLMRDQVQALIAHGIAAAFINSSLTDRQIIRALQNARQGEYKIIYIAPERLLTQSMAELAQDVQISLVAVDEAHCISQWGNDFRPAYVDIPKFIEALPHRPILAAFTATATERVRDDIVKILGLNTPISMTTGFDRPNLYFEVKQPPDKFSALMHYLQEKNDSGVVYCSTRKEVESVAEGLAANGYSVAKYHAGLADNERSHAQDDFLHDRVKIIVATNAFGMGIDKSNVRFVIHYNMPQNVEAYYQEAGRAGRDGLPAECILFYARKDINTALFLINKSENPSEASRNRHLLNLMERYCETDECLRSYILKYFGETVADNQDADGVGQTCGNCGNCLGQEDREEIDATLDAKKILSHITRLNKMGKHLMFTTVSDILLGKTDFLTDLPTFGIMKGTTRKYIRQLTNRLTAMGYIQDDGRLTATPTAREVLFGDATVIIRRERRIETGSRKAGVSNATARTTSTTSSAKAKSQKKEAPRYAVSDALFEELKKLRLEIAKEENMPAFVIFSDATLIDMCQKHPLTSDEMLSVSGIGEIKLQRYGEKFLEVLQRTDRTPATQEPLEELTAELFLQKVHIDKEPIQISRVADNCNAVLIRYDLPKVTGAKLNNMLLEAGYLEEINIGEIENIKTPTDKGRDLGIVLVERKTENSGYTQCLFGAEAQRFCAVWVTSL